MILVSRVEGIRIRVFIFMVSAVRVASNSIMCSAYPTGSFSPGPLFFGVFTSDETFHASIRSRRLSG